MGGAAGGAWPGLLGSLPAPRQPSRPEGFAPWGLRTPSVMGSVFILFYFFHKLSDRVTGPLAHSPLAPYYLAALLIQVKPYCSGFT